MHRPTVSLSALMLFLGGGMLAASTACGQLPFVTDHCGGIIPFVDDDPYFPYAYPTVSSGQDGSRMTQRSVPWQNYQSGCDPVYDEAVYGAVGNEAVSASQKEDPAPSAAGEDKEYVDFPYELTYDDDPKPNAAESGEWEAAEPPADYSEYDVYEPVDEASPTDADASGGVYEPYDESSTEADDRAYAGDEAYDSGAYGYDEYGYDEYGYDEYDYDEYGYDGANGEYDNGGESDVAASEPHAADGVTSHDSLSPNDVGAEPAAGRTYGDDDDYGSGYEYGEDDDYYGDGYGSDYGYGEDDYYYGDDESSYGEADDAVEPDTAEDVSGDGAMDDNNVHGEEYGYGYDYEYDYDGYGSEYETESADDGVRAEAPTDAFDSADDYEDFPYELTYDDDPADVASEASEDLAWLADDLACWLSHYRDRAMGWVCETGVEASLREGVLRIRRLSRYADLNGLVELAQAAQRVEAEAPVATGVREAQAADPAVMNRWARVQTALLLDRLGESLQRVSRAMLLRVASETQPSRR